MVRTEILEKVPANRVDEIVRRFKKEGATVTTAPDNGTFKVTAVFETETDEDPTV